MGESEQHEHLVCRIVDHIRQAHRANPGLSILADIRAVAPERRPGKIGGFTPDVLARTVPSSFVIIGEAKSFSDFFTPHTERQISAFVDYLRSEDDPRFVFAVPLQAVGAAKSMMRRIRRRLDAGRVPVDFLLS